jgi:hypothetical protein
MRSEEEVFEGLWEDEMEKSVLLPEEGLKRNNGCVGVEMK